MDIKCENCKNKFPSGIISKGGSFTFKGGIAATCPNCGYTNNISPGKVEFDEQGNIIKAYLLESALPNADLTRFLVVVKAYINENNSDQAAFKNEISAINPKLSALINLVTIKNASDFYSFLGLLIPLIVTLLTSNLNPSTTIINNNTIINNSYSDTFEERLRQQRLDSIQQKKMELFHPRKAK